MLTRSAINTADHLRVVSCNILDVPLLSIFSGTASRYLTVWLRWCRCYHAESPQPRSLSSPGPDENPKAPPRPAVGTAGAVLVKPVASFKRICLRNGTLSRCCQDLCVRWSGCNKRKRMLYVVRATWSGSGQPGQVRRTGGGEGEQWGEGSDAQGHVTEQPLLGAAAVAVSQGGDHLVLLGRHVQALVAVHVKQRESLYVETDTSS